MLDQLPTWAVHQQFGWFRAIGNDEFARNVHCYSVSSAKICVGDFFYSFPLETKHLNLIAPV